MTKLLREHGGSGEGEEVEGGSSFTKEKEEKRRVWET